MWHRIEVSRPPDTDRKKVYWLETTEEIAAESLAEVFSNPAIEDIVIYRTTPFVEVPYQIDVFFHSSMTDSVADSAKQALHFLQPKKVLRVHSGFTFLLQDKEDHSAENLRKKYAEEFNPIVYQLTTYRKGDSLHLMPNWTLAIETQRQVQVVDIFSQKFDFRDFCRERHMEFSPDEWSALVQYFVQEKPVRLNLGLPAEPTDVEIEVLAQTWSEHCKHKIFAAEIIYTESPDIELGLKRLGPLKITSLYKSFIQRATQDYEKNHPGVLVSVFHDNAGIVRWDETVDLCVKVETHNSPSALDPYSGAITGILGVQRDIMGTGLGAKPIANLDVFCVAEEKDFPPEDSPLRPLGLHRPMKILKGVHKGVEDGGNKMGVPTVNGSFQFSPNFAGKPLIFVGSLGLMPRKIAGRNSSEKRIQAGDLIVVAGGRLGRDGIHGATFSSMQMQEGAPQSVVQLGDPITQKRLLDFTLVARDQGWIEAITDNGAGGLSSSIGELAQISGGARLDISKHPVKYPGLAYFEMVISESQERMSYAVSSQNIEAFLACAKDYGVEASVLGEFTSTGRFDIYFEEKILASLDLDFMHKGVPRMQMSAKWQGAKDFQTWLPLKKSIAPKSYLVAGTQLLASANICSKEKWVRAYDHEVQGATIGKNFVGRSQKGPGDGGILDLSQHGGGAHSAVAIAHGFSAKLSHIDTYYMTQMAMDEALRNLVALGVNPEQVAFLDNYSWPDPSQDEHKMAQLFRSAQALYDSARAFDLPFVSGKDSMKNTFRGKNQAGEAVQIDVDPSLLITAIGFIPEKKNRLSSDFKRSEDLIYLLGESANTLRGSEYERLFDIEKQAVANIDLLQNKKLYQKIFQAAQKNLLSSCHDISDGGLFVGLCESVFGSELGAKILSEPSSLAFWFGEVGGSFVVSTKPENQKSFEEHFVDTNFLLLGKTCEDRILEISALNIFEPIESLERAWRNSL